jgi:hypothetical protein
MPKLDYCRNRIGIKLAILKKNEAQLRFYGGINMMFTNKRDSWGCVVNAYSMRPRCKRGRVRGVRGKKYNHYAIGIISEAHILIDIK